MTRPPPRSTLFPYTTLFRSAGEEIVTTSHAYGAVLKAMRVWAERRDRKSTRLNSSHRTISYAVFCLKKKTSTSKIVSVPFGGVVLERTAAAGSAVASKRGRY